MDFDCMCSHARPSPSFLVCLTRGARRGRLVCLLICQNAARSSRNDAGLPCSVHGLVLLRPLPPQWSSPKTSRRRRCWQSPSQCFWHWRTTQFWSVLHKMILRVHIVTRLLYPSSQRRPTLPLTRRRLIPDTVRAMPHAFLSALTQWRHTSRL